MPRNRLSVAAIFLITSPAELGFNRFCEVLKGKKAPEVGLEPTTNRLTADRSTTELLRN